MDEIKDSGTEGKPSMTSTQVRRECILHAARPHSVCARLCKLPVCVHTYVGGLGSYSLIADSFSSTDYCMYNYT